MSTHGDTVKFFRQLRSQASANYQIIRWVVTVFLGGVVNAAVLFTYIKFAETPIPLPVALGVVVLIAFTALVAVTPILISILFTELLPYKKIVPPFYLLVIAAALVFVTDSSYFISQDGALYLYLLTMYAAVGGMLSDSLVAFLVGRSVVREDVIISSFKVGATLAKVKTTLLTEKYRKQLSIDSYAIDEESGLVRLKSVNRGTPRNRFLIEVQELDPTKEDFPNVNEICRVDIVSFKFGSYSLERTEQLEEWTRKTLVGYLKDIFERESIKYDLLPNAKADKLVDIVVDSQMGFIQRSGAISRSSWVKAILFLFFLGLGFYFVITGTNQTTILSSLTIIVGLISFAIFSNIGRIPRRRAAT